MAIQGSRHILEEFAPPQNIEAEMCTLGSMLLMNEAAEQVFSLLRDEDFYLPSHQEVFRAMRQLSLSNRAIDVVTLKSVLHERGKLAEAGGTDYLNQLAESVPSAYNANYYAQIVMEQSLLRRLEAAGRQIVGLVRDPDRDVDQKVDHAERVLFEVGGKRLGKDFQPLQNLTKEFFTDVDRIIETGEPMLGLPSGFYDLDELTTGFYPGNLIILAARPSMGKSSLMLGFALHAARIAARAKNEDLGAVAIFSLEMGGIELVRRMASMLSGVPSQVMKTAEINPKQYQSLADACDTLYGLPIFIDDTSDLSPLEMRGKCRRLKAQGGLSLVIVDYLQLMRGSRRTENRVQEISEIARSLKALSKELSVPVIALSQLNRGVESRDDKRPQLSDLRESGSIEAEADLVMMIYREKYYKDRENPHNADMDPDRVEDAEVIVAKHRNGPVGPVVLGWEPTYARFRNLKV